MEPVVVALASNERYFPGLYCAVASALTHLDPAREIDLKVLDGGISDSSRNVLSQFVARFQRSVRFEFVPIDVSIFRGATVGPGRTHMAYCRILLPHLLAVPRVIYLDCDVLVFRDLSRLFDLELSAGKFVAAVPDSETCSLADDSRGLAKALKLPAEGAYFNSGVMLMNLDELRKQGFFERAVEFLGVSKSDYRFHDQSAVNFLLHEHIEELPEYWNRASWRFDQQEENDLDLKCILHYTRSVPWLGATAGPAQAVFERFAVEAGLPVNRQMAAFERSRRQRLIRNAFAPFRVPGFALVSLFYRIVGEKEKCAAYQKVARYWFHYILNAPHRGRLHQRRIKQIQSMKFNLPVVEAAA